MVRVVTAGGKIPGQLISGNLGDEFQINVVDDLNNATMDVVSTIVSPSSKFFMLAGISMIGFL